MMRAINWTSCNAESSQTISSRCLLSAGAWKNDDSGAYRVIYTARLADAIYVLHAFQKKTQATARRDVELARKRFAELMRGAR